LSPEYPELYQSATMPGLPGMSGGPICVQFTNSLGEPFFFPAGVYLGGSGQSVARIIDVDVVDLINRAENSGKIGTNHTGGGVVLVNASLGGSVDQPSLLTVRIGPASAVRMGGKWRISPTNFGNLAYLASYTNYTSNEINLAVRTNNFSIEMTNVAGFIFPPNHSVTIVKGQNVLLDLNYSVIPPRLLFNNSMGLGITGIVSTAYKIESTSHLPPGGVWSPVTNITLSAGTNWIPNTTAPNVGNRFYRAVWLSD
jgi:hypothetical protein